MLSLAWHEAELVLLVATVLLELSNACLASQRHGKSHADIMCLLHEDILSNLAAEGSDSVQAEVRMAVIYPVLSGMCVGHLDNCIREFLRHQPHIGTALPVSIVAKIAPAPEADVDHKDSGMLNCALVTLTPAQPHLKVTMKPTMKAIA